MDAGYDELLLGGCDDYRTSEELRNYCTTTSVTSHVCMCTGAKEEKNALERVTDLTTTIIERRNNCTTTSVT